MSEKIDPNEVQKELEDIVKSKFGDNVKIVTQKMDFDPLNLTQDKQEFKSKDKKIDLSFNLKPKDVFNYLEEYVIGQDEAKKTLSIAICDHYNHIKKIEEKSSHISHYSKQNVLMLGPTGVGKTYLVKKLAELVGVPFVKADATKFTEAGYVGANVEDTIRDLVTQADGHIELAQYGIVYIDEADKLAGSRKVAGKDVSGRGVQNGMLKLLEESEVDAKNPFDMMAQVNSLMMGGDDKKKPKTINTKNILFIFSGAFWGLEDIVKKRLNVSRIGLGTSEKAIKADRNLFAEVTTKDLMDFGLEAELIGRLPVRVHLNDLSEEHLYHILKDSKESIIHQYHDAFDSYGIKIKFTDEALKEIAKKAYLEKTGARSLMTIIEKFIREFKFELPSMELAYLVIDKELVQNPKQVLAKLKKQFSH
ncbi:MAG: AAA family ATPase [Bacteriovoracaceae bacterium]|jgi:endopeptidase Clp ATP-binding regulatory subunit ClpX|nr:ATP-dependent protease [Halobacteriovoraceae bacterium]MDP7321178.1 AAA family ATPase [Bacteriovoracaceae bacterium]|tara:strand:+ start:281 stop:1540 length:1260 start_codon:yes stop_codon:yes gene_type:complete